MIAWEDIRQDFVPDGAWRDVYVFGTSAEDWQVFLDMARSRGLVAGYSVDGEPAELPRTASDVLSLAAAHRLLLRLAVGAVDLSCHFFGEDRIELDLDPKTVDEEGFEELLDFIAALGDLLEKDVVLTYENTPAAEILRYSGGEMSTSRAWACPGCGKPELRIAASFDLGPDERSDEVALQTVECGGCGFRGLAVYEESRRGAGETWEHAGYEVAPETYERVAADIRDGKARAPSEYLAGGERRFVMRR